MKNSDLIKKAVDKGFTIGFVDTETSPWLAMGYGVKKLFLGHKQILIPHKITSYSILSENNGKESHQEWDFKGPIILDHKKISGGGDDRRLVRKLVKEVNSFNLLIAQNGDRFDFPQIQTRALLLGVGPLDNVITLDTLKLNRKTLSLLSNKLDYLSLLAGAGGKIDQDITDCIQTALGNKKISKERLKYNIKDTKDLQKVFWFVIDYVKLPDKIVNMLKNYIKEERIFCIKCASRRQRRYDIAIDKNKRKCNNCDYTWRDANVKYY